MFAGLGAARIRRLFKQARENAPAILFIDELDAVGGVRGSDISGERDQTLNQLLVEMDGFESADNIVVMAASNLLEKLDPALLRPGRFDRQVFVPPPDLAGREQILRVHSRYKPLAEEVDLHLVAQHTVGLTGADLANLCNEAAIQAGRGRVDAIRQEDFDNAFERVVAGLQSRKVITPHEKRVVAWHEAGHVLVSELLPTVDKVQKVSIIPRGKALGYTLNLPQEDRYLKSREELIDYQKVLLGGRVAEQITFGRVTTGAADDLSKVTQIARAMVFEYAMGTSIRAHQVPGDDWNVSEMMRERRDDEVQAIAEEAYRGAYALISSHRDALDAIAERLLEKESIERGEIVEMLDAGHVAVAPPRLASMLSRIDHVGVAVADLDAAIAFYEGTLGMPLVHREVVEEQGVEAVLLDVGDGHVELLASLGAETPVGKFLDKKGPGLHHVAYAVEDIEVALATLDAAGVELIDSVPRTGIRDSRVAFVHPRSTGAVLTELVEPAHGGGAGFAGLGAEESGAG